MCFAPVFARSRQNAAPVRAPTPGGGAGPPGRRRLASIHPQRGFGCVLYEMLTGRRAFEAKTQPPLIAAIVGRQPQPVSAVQPLTSPAHDRVIAACLAKDQAVTPGV